MAAKFEEVVLEVLRKQPEVDPMRMAKWAWLSALRVLRPGVQPGAA